jgi:hypothetical protein
MSALKLSTSQRRIYSGLQGKQLLLDSINFLFAIKGKEFVKQYPSFSTPDATLFIAYSHIVNRNIVGKRQKETNKTMDLFLKFICGDVVSATPLMRCIYVVILSLGSYTITEFILMGRDEMPTNYVAAFNWYTSQVVTCVQSNNDRIVGTIGRFMEISYFSRLPTIIKNFTSTDDVSALAIGSYVICELHSDVDVRTYDYVVQLPYMAVLYKKGLGTFY